MSFNQVARFWAAGKYFSEMHEMISLCSAIISSRAAQPRHTLSYRCSVGACIKFCCDLALKWISCSALQVSKAQTAIAEVGNIILLLKTRFICFCLLLSANEHISNRKLSLKVSWEVWARGHVCTTVSWWWVVAVWIQSTSEWGRWQCILILGGSKCCALELGVLVPEYIKSGCFGYMCLEITLAGLGLLARRFNAPSLNFSAYWSMG